MQKDVIWKTAGLGLFLLGRCKLNKEKIFFPVEKLSKLLSVTILYFSLIVILFQCYNTVKQHLKLLT